MRKYTPRRASLKRWLEDAPEYILDVFDNKSFRDHYTVLLCGSKLISDGTRAGTYIPYLAISSASSHPRRISFTGELAPHEAGAFRYRFSRYRIRWLDLPEHIREHVGAYMADEGSD